MKEINLIGQKFTNLLVIKKSEKRGNRNQLHWDCLCDCGKKVSIYSAHLTSKHTKSCGCRRLRSELKHNLSRTRFYSIYRGIENRCNDIKNKRYKDYGGRGIKCKWKHFLEYRDDMYKSYLKHSKKYGEINTTIDRIDYNGNYSKENCRWATKQEQSNNMRNNILITYKNKTLTLSNWSRKLNIRYGTLATRLQRGWSIDRAFNKQSTHISKCF